MSKEQKPRGPKPPATPQGDFWDAVRVTSDGDMTLLTDDIDTPSKDDARLQALSAFLLRGEIERVYIVSRATQIDCTADMRKVEAEWRRRGQPDRDIDEIVRAVLPTASDKETPTN
jgi:hypothetical protein